MNADFLVLCGGLGTRLRPVAGEIPKVMVEVQGEPFLDFLIRYIIKQGGRRIILCAGYKAEALSAHYKKKFKEVEMSIEPGPLGTGGAFKYAEKLVRSDLVFGLNGDCFMPVPYAQMLSFHEQKKGLITLAGVRVEGNKDFGTIVVNAQDEVMAFREKFETKEAQYISAGVYCFRKEVLGMMPPGKFSIEYDFFPKLIGKGFFGFKVDAPFIDIGTPERFEWAKQHLGEMLQ